MNSEQQKSILAIALHAAFADGAKHERERGQIRRIADSLAAEAGGRVMSTALLRDSFQNLLGPAKQMQAQYLPQIEQQARGLDVARVMQLVSGG